MNVNDYQKTAARTLLDKPDTVYTDEEIMLVWNVLGLVGEAGEVAELVKKAVFHRHGIDRVKIAKELGDVQWYIAACATKLKLLLEEDIMGPNIEKLKRRYPQGYSSDASKGWEATR